MADNVRKELVRDELINKAAELFYSKGYAQTSINDIAEELGLKRSSVYHYFKNKEQILSTLVEEESTVPYNNLVALLDRTDLTPTQRLKMAVVQGIVRRLSGGPRFLVLSRLEAEMPTDLAALYSRHKRQILDIYTEMVSEGVRVGEFRALDARIAAFAIIGMANWTSWWYSPKGKRTPQQIAEEIVDIAMRGLASDGGSRTTPAADSLGAAIRNLRQDLEVLERLAGSGS
ncbi:TetR/AcrR family transcriptional regulator [Azospirillum soli]|uniref:TetR/AcrR family transcriptional regulator n=1 Tax=Azospirillum soli TaxID=1304799 RepID=UPI001AE24770|nr:TetR/AcrR family transcriptional regulator [Azospirillum soli]MBP2316582.1 AcrR family transcriptional regulator [Azospirillum soli]